MSLLWQQPTTAISDIRFDAPLFEVEHDGDLADAPPELRALFLQFAREAFYADTHPLRLGVHKPKAKMRRALR